MAGMKFEVETPKMQTTEAVKALITYLNHGKEPAQLPDFFRLTGEMVLVKSNRGDCYYVTTPTDCSCPARTYNPGKPCKHSRRYFPQPATVAKVAMDEPLIQRGGFKPFAEA